MARTMIAKAVAERDEATLHDLRAFADGMQLMYRRAGAKLNADEAGEIKVRAERGLGQIDLKARPRGRPAADAKDTGTRNFPEIHPNTRADWRNRLAGVSDKRFGEIIDEARADEHAGVSTARLIQIIRFGSTMSSTTFECYTPAVYIEAARAVLDGIDLDPASSAEANETVGAAEFLDAESDGLAQDWHGRIWLNPPYGRSLTSAFVTKLVAEFDAGRVTAGITVLNAYGFDAAWFQPLFAHVLCFTDHRINFYGGGPTFGSLFAYLGPEQRKFARVFRQFGAVVKAWP
jgi:ParB family chromosome partitioning protein